MDTLTLRDLLAGINAYPIPPLTLIGIGEARGLDISATATQESMKSKAYRLCRADVLMWLAGAPDISQGGQSYSFTDEQRNRFRAEAQGIMDELEAEQRTTIYGYKGSRL